MKNKLLSLVVIPFLVSCNIYSPLRSTNEVEEYLEEAQKCLHDDDFACAIENYNKLPAGTQKEEKLCLVYLAQGGLTLNALINTVTQSTSSMLGALAQKLVPWTAAKGTAIDNAKTHCLAYRTLTGTTQAATLYTTLAYYSHCAIRLAKADVLAGANAGDTACTTSAPHSDGLVKREDISPDSTGALSSAGMCSADADMCATDIAAVSGSDLVTAGLTNIKAANDAIPGGITGGGGTQVVRAALRTTFSSR